MSARHWFDAPRAREAVAILLGGLTILVVAALVSYSPTDPSLFTSGAESARNWIGPAGAHVSALLFEGLGFAAWFFPAVLLAAMLRELRGEREKLRRSAVLGFLLVGFATAVFLSLVVGRIEFRGAALLSGGLLGDLSARALVSLFSEIGSLVLTGTLLLVGATLVARSSLADSSATLVHALGRHVPSLRPALQALSRALAAAGRTLDPLPLLRALRRRIRRSRRKPLAEPLSAVIEPEEAPAPPAPVEEAAAEEARPAPRRKTGKAKKLKARQVALPVEMPEGPGVRLPPAEMLETAPTQAPISRRELLAVAELIRRRCAEFQVEGQVTEFHPGPVVTTYEFRPNAGIKLSRITALADDLALALEAENVRIDRIPGRPTVGIEVPNRRRETITLRQVVESPEFRASSDLLTLGLGKSQSGEIFCAALSKMPHLLVAGSTGSGKSVGLNAMIASVLYRAKPDQVKFILVDPKMLELGVYAGLPHLLVPVVTDMKLAGNALKWAVREMERRYRLLAACNVRHLDSFNRLLKRDKAKVEGAIESMPERAGEKYEAKHLPYIVIVVDELADMLMTTGPDVVEAIARLAQKARAVGIHLILATQRPSVDVLVGAIKANFPARIAFRVASKIDSRTILDAAGAERLLGSGDMLFRHPSSSRLTRVHGAWVSESECMRVVEWIKAQAEAEYDESVLDDPPDTGGSEGASGVGEDPLYNDAVRVVVSAGQGSTSFLQRKMGLGYSRAARIVDQLEENGILGPADGSKPRKCLVGADFLERLSQQEEDDERF